MACRIESGYAKSITDLAEQEGLADAYVCRLLPLTCLAPGHRRGSPRTLMLERLERPLPASWAEQRDHLGW